MHGVRFVMVVVIVVQATLVAPVGAQPGAPADAGVGTVVPQPLPAIDVDTRELAAALEPIATSIKRLEDRGPSRDWLGFIGACIAAAISLAALLSARKAAKSADATARAVAERTTLDAWDEFTRKSRVEAYTKLFACFEPYPQEPARLGDESREEAVSAVSHALVRGYYQHGAGLLMTDDAQKAFFGARNMLDWMVANWKTLDGTDDERYRVAFECSSRVRTALVRDIRGRRELGSSPEPKPDEPFKTFVDTTTRRPDDTDEKLAARLKGQYAQLLAAERARRQTPRDASLAAPLLEHALPLRG